MTVPAAVTTPDASATAEYLRMATRLISTRAPSPAITIPTPNDFSLTLMVTPDLSGRNSGGGWPGGGDVTESFELPDPRAGQPRRPDDAGPARPSSRRPSARVPGSRPPTGSIAPSALYESRVSFL